MVATRSGENAFTAAIFFGLILIVWAISAFLDLTSGIGAAKANWFLFVLGVSFVVGAGFAIRGATRYGLLAATLFLGGAAQLWLLEPLWFPVLTFDATTGWDVVMVALIVAQLAITLALMRQQWTLGACADLCRGFGWGKVILFLALTLVFSVSLMGHVSGHRYADYGMQLLASSVLIPINILTIAALAVTPTIAVPWPRPVVLGLVALISSALLSWFAFERIPHVEDEVAYLFQARTFLTGSLFSAAPPAEAVAGLDYYLLDVRDGRWFATTPPGWPVMLAIGEAVGLPWLVNPVLAAFIVCLAFVVTRRLGAADRAPIVAVLLAVSPWFLGSSGSMLAHNTGLVAILGAWALLLGAVQPEKIRLLPVLGAGLLMGWLFTTRQLDGVVIGGLTGLWLLTRRGLAQTIIPAAVFALGCLITGSVFLLFNLALTGSLLDTPLAAYLNTHWYASANAFGFGPEIGPPGGWGGLDLYPGHGPLEAILNTTNNFSALSFELLGWGAGSLALVMIYLLWGRTTGTDRQQLLLAFAVISGMFFYWFAGSFYVGPRYWFGLMFPVLFLSAGGFLELKSRLQSRLPQAHSADTLLMVLCGFSLLVFVSWRGVEKYHGYQKFTRDFARATAEGEFGNSVVFFDTDGQVGAALFLNRPGLPADQPVFLRDLGPEENAAAAAAFPDREVVYFRHRVAVP